MALMARSFNIVVVNPKSPIKSIADLIAAAKADPAKLSYGTYGTGTSAHLAGELFKSLAKVNLTTVPYKGAAPAITDLIGGQIQVMFTTVASAAALIAGRAVARARGDVGAALAGIPRSADGRRGRRSRLFRRELVWPVRAGRHPRMSSTASTVQRPRPFSPRLSRSSPSTRALSWLRVPPKNSTAISAARKRAGAR